MIRAIVQAGVAMGAGHFVLHHIENLHFLLSIDDFKQICHQTHDSEKYLPRDDDAEITEPSVYGYRYEHPHPELQGIDQSTGRTDVSAPEAVDDETSKDHYAYSCHCHPQCRSAFKSGQKKRDYQECQAVLDDSQNEIGNGAVRDVQFLDSQRLVQLHQNILHST